MVCRRMVIALFVVVSSLLASGAADEDRDSVDRIRVTVSVGGTVKLPCRKPGRENATVAEWNYQKSHGQRASRVWVNNIVLSRFRRRFSVRSANDSGDDDRRDFSLVISPVIRADVGVYTCLIAGPSDELLRFVHLDVTEAAILQKAVVGNDVTLPCNSSFLNPVEWTRRDNASGRMATVVKGGRVSYENSTRFSVRNDSHLVISNVTLSDAGLYLCTEDIGFGAKHPVFLFVLEDGDENSSVWWQKFYSEFNNSVKFELIEDSLTDDGHPIVRQICSPTGKPFRSPPAGMNWLLLPLAVVVLFVVVGVGVIAGLTCTCQYGVPRRLLDHRNDEIETESSSDDSVKVRPQQPQRQQRRRKRRERLYGVSLENINDVVQSSDAELRIAAPASRAQLLPGSFDDPGTVEPRPQVAPGTSTGPVAGPKSQDIPGTVADSTEAEPRLQSFPGPGAVAAAVAEPQTQAASSVIVVQAAVERQPPDSSAS